MRFLLDTNVLLWAMGQASRLPAEARAIIHDRDADVFFSPVSIWEIVIKSALRRADFQVSADRVRSAALRAGYEEVVLTSSAALRVADLPSLHRDPFDRILVAQAMDEGASLLTSDTALLEYPHVRCVS